MLSIAPGIQWYSNIVNDPKVQCLSVNAGQALRKHDMLYFRTVYSYGDMDSGVTITGITVGHLIHSPYAISIIQILRLKANFLT